jgi:nitrite reductase (NADH) small subunit
MAWTTICNLEEIPSLGSRIIKSSEGDIAVFRTSSDEVFALFDKCPHKGGPLSQGIVHGKRVTCPLHNWVIELESGEAVAPDEGCAHNIAARVEDGKVSLDLDEAITAVA